MRVLATREPRRSTCASALKCGPRRAQVVDAQIDRAQLGKARQALLGRLVHVARADGRHHRQAGGGVQHRADHAAVQALVLVVADQLGPHVDAAAHALARQLGHLQAQQGVEDDALLEQLRQAGDEGGLEGPGGDRGFGAHGSGSKRVNYHNHSLPRFSDAGQCLKTC
jgi:hypothetical protein